MNAVAQGRIPNLGEALMAGFITTVTHCDGNLILPQMNGSSAIEETCLRGQKTGKGHAALILDTSIVGSSVTGGICGSVGK